MKKNFIFLTVSFLVISFVSAVDANSIDNVVNRIARHIRERTLYLGKASEIEKKLNKMPQGDKKAEKMREDIQYYQREAREVENIIGAIRMTLDVAPKQKKAVLKKLQQQKLDIGLLE